MSGSDLQDRLTILGGGVAGLAAAYAATRRGLKFRLHEGSERLGGNAVTLRLGDHLFDSGAHRLHARDPGVLEELRALLPGELRQVHAPSRVYYRGRTVDFPFSPMGLLSSLPAPILARATVDLLRARLRRAGEPASFHDFATRRYGKTLAEAFLLSYSQKLWGHPCRELSPAIAGNRLGPLGFRELLRQALGRNHHPSRHLEGTFYYPRRGIGRVVEALATACPADALLRRHRVTRIAHDGARIRGIRIGRQPPEGVGEVICTLPLSLTVQLLDPPPPERIQRLCRGLSFRNVVLVVLALDVPSISEYASTYFPEAHFPFTRVHEPRCRSPEMAPTGKTSLVAEIPCQHGDAVWSSDDESLRRQVCEVLVEDLGWLRHGNVLDSAVHRMRHAYPVQRVDTETECREILDWLDGFENLTVIGRGSRFAYLHIHDLVAAAMGSIEVLSRKAKASTAAPRTQEAVSR